MTTMMKIVHVPDKSTSLEETNFSFGKIQKIDSTKNRRSKNAQLITDIYCRYQCEAKPVLTLFISFLFINTASDAGERKYREDQLGIFTITAMA